MLSHYRGDHFDEVAARNLDKKIPIVSTRHAIEKLRPLGFVNGHYLDTWESQAVEKGDARLDLTAMPAEHANDFELRDMLMPVNGSMLDFNRGDERLFRLYITGGTMLHKRLHDIPLHYPDIDLALVHAGGTTLFVTVVTMTGEQAVRAVEITKPRRATPIHYNDFSVFRSGLDDFKKAAEKSSADTDFHYLRQGETYQFQSTAVSAIHRRRMRGRAVIISRPATSREGVLASTPTSGRRLGGSESTEGVANVDIQKIGAPLAFIRPRNDALGEER